MKASFLLQAIMPGAAALVLLVGSGRAHASDTPVAPSPPAAAPLAIPCPTCAAGAPAPAPGGSWGKGGSCKTCRTIGRKCSHCAHCYAPYLCPGACFGYFQTQWHRWEDVCPIPYQGTGVSDSPPPATPYIPAPGATTPMGKPPVEPQKKPGEPEKKPGMMPTGIAPIPAAPISPLPTRVNR